LVIGGIALLIGLVVFPALKKASAFREQQLESLEDEQALLADLTDLVAHAGAVQQENELLREALKGADDLLFPAIDNPIMAQSAAIRLLNELGPDLELEVNAGRSSVGDAAHQMNLSVRGRGRYPEILKFIYRMETYRPLVLVNSISLMAPKSKSKHSRSKHPTKQKTSDPNMSFRLNLQLYSRASGEGGA
jgi:hypothetical protein